MKVAAFGLPTSQIEGLLILHEFSPKIKVKTKKEVKPC